MTDRKAVIKNADMSEDMQQDAGMSCRKLIIDHRSLSNIFFSRHRYTSFGKIQH